MRIFNEEKTQEIQEYDEKLYYLKPDKLLIKHYDAVDEVKKISHLEVFRVNEETGGVEYKEVVDVPYQPAIEAYDEYEDIQVIVPYTEKEINKARLNDLTAWFNTTYRYKHEKYTRLIALNKLDDDGVDPNEKLLALYEEAEDVRRQIQELEEE